MFIYLFILFRRKASRIFRNLMKIQKIKVGVCKAKSLVITSRLFLDYGN